MTTQHRHHALRPGHSLMELIVAMVASTMLLAGLASVMFIARQVAYTPSAAARRTEAAQLVSQLADELRYATTVIQHVDDASEQTLEFVVTDRDNPADGAAERIRYDWPQHPDPGAPADASVNSGLYKTVNGQTGLIANNVVDYRVVLEPPFVPGQRFSHARVRLQTGTAGHSRVDAAIPLVARPELLIAFWRTDFDTDPTDIDVDADGNLDWVVANGATFVSNSDTVHSPGELSDGTWYANGDLATNPSIDFTAVTMVEARYKNMAATGMTADVLRINADRQGAAYAAIVIRMQRQLDGSQTLSLLGLPTSGVPVTLPVDTSMLPSSAVDNLPDDYVRVRLIILPAQNKVNLKINDVDLGTFTYQTNAPTSTDRCVKIGGGAKFDYVEVRVANN